MLDNRHDFLIILGTGFFLILSIIGLSWANYRFAVENPGGNDFLVHWVGTRSLLVDGISPYNDEVALRIQTMAYGRPARSGEHELRVAYPLYSAAIFFPFALINDYTLARAFWMTALELALFGTLILCLKITGWRPKPWLLALLLLFTLTWYHSVRGVINGNAVILITFLIAGAFAAIQSGRDELAGILLAVTTIKPQVVILIIVFVWIWAISNHRWSIVIWTILSILSMSVLAALFVPDWLVQNFQEVIRYPGYNPPGTPGTALATWLPAAGEKIGWGITVVLGVLLIVEWSAARGHDFGNLFWTGSLTLVASQWIGIQTDPGNFVILIIPLVLVMALFARRWGAKSRWLNLCILLLLFIGLWVLFLTTVEYGDQPQQSPIMFFPLPLFLFIGLYWVRWWALKPPRLLIDTF